MQGNRCELGVAHQKHSYTLCTAYESEVMKHELVFDIRNMCYTLESTKIKLRKSLSFPLEQKKTPFWLLDKHSTSTFYTTEFNFIHGNGCELAAWSGIAQEIRHWEGVLV